MAAKSNEKLKNVFQDEMSAALLTESSSTQPLLLKTKRVLLSALTDYHLMLKVKAAMDQFIDGLGAMGILEPIRANPEGFSVFFKFSEVPHQCW